MLPLADEVVAPDCVLDVAEEVLVEESEVDRLSGEDVPRDCEFVLIEDGLTCDVGEVVLVERSVEVVEEAGFEVVLLELVDELGAVWLEDGWKEWVEEATAELWAVGTPLPYPALLGALCCE